MGCQEMLPQIWDVRVARVVSDSEESRGAGRSVVCRHGLWRCRMGIARKDAWGWTLETVRPAVTDVM